MRNRKGQWLLALLVLRGDGESERDWLAGTLWPESSHASALLNLRGSLHDLRRALGPEADRLRSPTRCTLAFDLSGSQTDVLEFDRAITSTDCKSLEQAISLYRGPLLEGCVEGWAFQERQVREQAYLRALETLAARSRADGDLAGAEQYLRRIVTVEPHRESAQRELMQLLAERGSYAAALQTYRDLRLWLHRELNAGPDPRTQALFERLRAEAQRPRATPPAVATRRVHPGGDIPAPPTSLLGRERELEAIGEILRGEAGRLLTLTGPGGTGKTHLALQAALDLRGVFEDGAFFFSLAPLRDPDLVGSTIAQTFGVRECPSQPLLESLKEYLQEKQMLLLLDNFEHLQPAAPLVAELLAAAPRLKALVTSRTALRLRGEKLLAIPPLALPDRRCAPPPAALSRFAAVQLFLQRAQDVRPEFAVTDENAPAVAEICHRLDGLPLAIELAAAKMQLMSPRAMLSRLTNRLSLLKSGAQDLPDRQQTLRDTIAWSYDLLTESEKALFRRLSVFVGGWTLGAAEAVCGADGGEPIDVLDGVASLVDKSLLRREEMPDGETRFMMLETIREYSQEWLSARGETVSVHTRHAHYFLAQAEEAETGLKGPDPASWVGRLEQEHDNLRAALSWCIDKEMGETGLRLGMALWPFWEVQDHWAEGRGRLEQLLALPEAAGRSSRRAKALYMASKFTPLLTEAAAARALCRESLEISRELGDRRGIAVALDFLGWIAHIHDDFNTARPLLEESHGIWLELDDQEGIAISLNSLGGLAYRQGDFGAARDRWEESLAMSQRLRRRGMMRHTWYNLGLAALEQGDCGAAERFLSECVEVAREVGSDAPLGELGSLAYQRGDAAAARTLFEESLTLAREREDKLAAAHALAGLARLACLQGDFLAADSLGGESLTLARAVGHDGSVAAAHYSLGESACARGDLESARQRYLESLSHFRKVPESPVFRRHSPRFSMARCLDGLARTAQKEDASRRAAQLSGAAEALRLATGDYIWPIPERAEHERHLSNVRASLDQQTFAAAWAEGQAMSLQEAIHHALEDTGST